MRLGNPDTQVLRMMCGRLAGSIWLEICALHVLYFNRQKDQDAMDWWSEHRFDYYMKPPPIPGRLI